MPFQPEPKHDLSPDELEEIELRLYEYNSNATGQRDGDGLGFVVRDADGRIVGAAAGYSWAGMAEIRQVWVDETHRGRGHARALLEAFIDEARRRGVGRIWLSTFDFQAPGLYEKLGFRRVAELADWPAGHTHIVMCRDLGPP